ncbi:MAG: POTRA domain-containing protein [Verrucomicrobiota bacterium]
MHTGYLVSDVLIEVTGKWIVPEHFKNIIKSKSGMPFSEDILREDVERIYASGYAEMVIVKVEYIGKKVKIRLKITAAEPA